MSVLGSSLTVEDIEASVRHYLGDELAQEVVVVSSASVFVAMPDTARLPNDIDLVVSEAAYRHIKNQGGWKETEYANKHFRLTKGDLDLATSWVTTSYQDIHARSWKSPGGIRMASLSDTYAGYQERGLQKDQENATRIRNRLQDTSKPPLHPRVMQYEMEQVRATLPAHLQFIDSAQAAIYLAAYGLLCTYTLYGDPRIGRPNQIVGELEKPEYGVLATYHNGFDLAEGLHTLKRHFDLVKASDKIRLMALAAETYADIIYGNGRYGDNPKGHDERRSAELLYAHARMIGFTKNDALRMSRAILATTFNEQTGSQWGRTSSEPVAIAVTGDDLQLISEQGSLRKTIALTFEDLCSARFSMERPLGKVLAKLHHNPINSIEDALLVTEKYAHIRPGGKTTSPTILDIFRERLDRNATFHDQGYKAPKGWTLEDKNVRRTNAQAIRKASQLLKRGMSLSALYEAA